MSASRSAPRAERRLDRAEPLVFAVRGHPEHGAVVDPDDDEVRGNGPDDDQRAQRGAPIRRATGSSAMYRSKARAMTPSSSANSASSTAAKLNVERPVSFLASAGDSDERSDACSWTGSR